MLAFCEFSFGPDIVIIITEKLLLQIPQVVLAEGGEWRGGWKGANGRSAALAGSR